MGLPESEARSADDRSIRAPIVAGVMAAEVDALLARASTYGAVERRRHRVGRGRVVIELEPEAGADSSDIVRSLRNDAFAVVAGPPAPAHAPVWARHNAPVAFGVDACVCFPWSPFDRDAVSLVVEIDPGAGFGAGRHPTTQLLLHRLDHLDLAGRRVLDVGSGTGVLGITAALRGAEQVVAVDVAASAVAATEANAVRNGVGDRVEIVDGELAVVAGVFDVVLANIHASVLVALAPELRRLTAPGGLLALSGLSPAQPSALIAALAPMVMAWTDESSEWVALGFEWSA